LKQATILICYYGAPYCKGLLSLHPWLQPALNSSTTSFQPVLHGVDNRQEIHVPV